MKKDWNKTWNSSTQPRKQRKFRHNAPIHIRRKLMASTLSKELRIKYKRRSFPVRVGDKVKVLRGQFKGKLSEIDKVDAQNYRIYLKDVHLKVTAGILSAPVRPVFSNEHLLDKFYNFVHRLCQSHLIFL